MLVLKINTTDRSNYVDWNSLEFAENLTKEPDTLVFFVRGQTGKTMPSLGDTIELLEDSVLIFAGLIVERKESIVGGILQGWSLGCKDYTHTLDKKLVSKSYENQTARDIILDIVANFTDGTFTTTNVAASTPIIASIRFNYEPVSKAIQQIADILGWDWRVAPDKDLHFFVTETQAAPFSLTDTGDTFEWRTLTFDRNILELVNTVIVRGGEYKSTILEADARDKYKGDGTRTTFQLGYKYANINVKKNGVSQTVGIDNVTDPGTVDCLYNFAEKIIRFPSPVTDGHAVTVYGDAYIPVIAKVRDGASIAAYGEYQKLELNKNLTSVAEAQNFGKAKLAEWSAGKYEAKFKTKNTGLKTGMTITVNSTLRNINRTFAINRITGRARTPSSMEYEVQLLASGDLTFVDLMLDLIARDRKNLTISNDEVVQRLETLDESMSMSDSISAPTKTSPPYYVGSTAKMGFFTMGA